jgi:hypothetical protein
MSGVRNKDEMRIIQETSMQMSTRGREVVPEVRTRY